MQRGWCPGPSFRSTQFATDDDILVPYEIRFDVANDADVDRVTKRHGVAARLFVGMHLNVVLGVSHSIVALDVEYGVRR